MFFHFLVNFCILFTFTFIGMWPILEKGIALSIFASQLGKVSIGIYAGLLGCILMLNTYWISDYLFLDLRMVPIGLAAIYGGIISSFLASLIVAVFRLTWFEADPTVFMIALNIVLIGVMCGLLVPKFKPGLRQTMLVNLAIMIYYSFMIIFFVDDSRKEISLIVVYWLLSFAAVYAAHRLIYYLFHYAEQTKRLKQLTVTDDLTGLFNSRQLNRLLGAYVRNEQPLVLMIMDIDYFKLVNDTYGHLAGHEVLKQVADILKSAAPHSSIICRNGGEEFVLLMPDLTMKEAAAAAETIRQSIEGHCFSVGVGQPIQITVSIGLTSYESGLTPREMIGRADRAMYESKKKGRNQISLYP